MEEEWLFDACADSYIPILNVIHKLTKEGISPKITIDISPILCEQLKDKEFKRKFKEFCQWKIDSALNDQKDFREKHIRYLTKMWETFYTEIYLSFIRDYDEDLVNAFKRLQDKGHIEIMSSSATHAYFPAIAEDASIQMQVILALKNYIKCFSKYPNGFWLPECGYRPSYHWKSPIFFKQSGNTYLRKGVEEFLSELNIKYFIVDHHQLMNAKPYDLKKDPFYAYTAKRPKKAEEPVTVLSRNVDLSLQVWSHELGYPGDGAYLEFHKKKEGGKLRYWKITNKKYELVFKDPYIPKEAEQKVKEHAGHYKWLITNNLKHHFESTGDAAMILTSFDAELYGHWWFEGPKFLYHVIKWISIDPQIKTESISEFLERMPAKSEVYLPESSWGNHYNNSTWINKETEWVLGREYSVEREMKNLVKDLGGKAQDDATLARIIKQAARELLLLQTSDWKFMITNWVARDLAENRITQHYNNFWRLTQLAWDYGLGRKIPSSEWEYLYECERKNGFFNEIELKGEILTTIKNDYGKIELVREIQKAEGNIPCFATERANNCDEKNCIWREDCLKYFNLKIK